MFENNDGLQPSIVGWVNSNSTPDPDLPEYLHHLAREEEVKHRTMGQDQRRKLLGQARRVRDGTNKKREQKKDDKFGL